MSGKTQKKPRLKSTKRGRSVESAALSVAQRKARYLRAMAKNLDPQKACAEARIDRTTVWGWAQKDPEFVDRLNLITEFATENVEGAVYRRAMKMSTPDARLWLQAHKRHLYGDQVDINFKKDPQVIALAQSMVEVLKEFVPKELFRAAFMRLGAMSGLLVQEKAIEDATVVEGGK